MRRLISFSLRLALSAACLGYALWGLDFQRIAQLAASIRLWPLLVSLLLSLVVFAIQGLRLQFLAGRQLSFHQATLATLFGLGLNYLLPARLGELGKAFYLQRHASLPVHRSLGLIFWERFSDLNIILLLAMGANLFARNPLAWLPLAGLVAGLWCCVGFILLFPGAINRLLLLLPFARVREFLQKTLRHFTQIFRPAFLLGLAGFSAATWGALLAAFAFIVIYVADLPVQANPILTAFVASSLSFAIPSAPGGLGIFEAATVFAFGLYGVDREAALIVALLIRLTQGIPAVLVTVLLLGKDKLNLHVVRQKITEADAESQADGESPSS